MASLAYPSATQRQPMNLIHIFLMLVWTPRLDVSGQS